jgi:regulation of enolase protein 1 (concanavalin A-like superfamily)
VNIWFEAEEADEILEPMLIFPGANGADPVTDAEGQGEPSGGSYIGTIPSSSGNNNFWTLDGASYNFTVPAGTYAIWARVSNVDDDSFWVSIPDGQYDVPVDPSGWIMWNGISPATPDWHWVRVHSDDAPGNAVVNVTLEAGEHTLIFLHRENENFLDAILITNELNLEATDLPDEVPEMLYTQAHHSIPQDGETEAPAQAVLSWQPGAYVEGQSPKHRVFFSENFDDVNDGIGGVIQDVEYYPINGTLDLDFEKTYYWRVDEVNNTTGWDIGNVWRFTVANYYILEDFEDYNDYEPDRIFDAWTDGWNIPANGSIIGYAEPDFEAGEHFVETVFVHGGSQSMPYFYDNTTADYSEATMTLSSLRDWTKQGVETLTIWSKGNPSALVEEPAGTYTIAATGADIWDTSDEFRYVYKQLSGNGSVSAQVLSIENTDPWAKAGVMIRQTLEPDSKFAAVYITPGNGCRFQGRLTPVAEAVSDTPVATDEQIAITAPYWIRIERDGDNFNGYYSSDGANWQAMAWNPQSIAMPTNVYVGMAVTSHSSNVFGKGKFSNVQITGTVSQQAWEQQAIGVEMQSNEPAQMYVVLDNSAVVYNDNPDAALMTEWTEWNIDLQRFADQGVNLTNVEKFGIGFGDSNSQDNGSGLVYFDDIRLHPSQSTP